MHGRPISGYESLKELLMLFKVKNNMFKRWLNISGCEIIEAMHNVDEVNTISNQ